MQCLEVSGAVRLIYKSLGVKRLILLKKAQAVVQKTPSKNVTSGVLIFSSLLSL